MGRPHGGRGFGHFAAGFGDGAGRGGAGFRTGRKLTLADLQLLILALLANKPSHGYELIKTLEERSGGFYSPSPGMVYPALTYLEEIGHATVEEVGAKKRYHITEEGRTYIEEHRAVADTILDELMRIGRRMEHVRRAFTGEDTNEDVGDEHVSFRGAAEFHTARRALKSAIHARLHASPQEARRIADILKRAAAEILGE